MPGSFKNRLLNYQEAPPPAAWADIEARLDQEFNPVESALSLRMDDTAMPPPEGVWAGIAEALDSKEVESVPAKTIPLIVRRLAIAAAILAVVSIPLFYFFQTNTTLQTRELAMVTSKTKNIKSGSLPLLSPAQIITAKPSGERVQFLPVTRPGLTRFAYAAPVADSAEEDEPEITEASFSDLQPVKDQATVSVAAAPIRDQQGHIIMDLSLITHADDPYITVTGPNGSQTKISSKFLNCLTYLNGDLSTSASDDQGILCIDQFKAWRDKLLNGDSFVPAAGNFFDIFEMKDLISE